MLPLRRSATPRASVSSLPVTLPTPSSTWPLISRIRSSIVRNLHVFPRSWITGTRTRRQGVCHPSAAHLVLRITSCFGVTRRRTILRMVSFGGGGGGGAALASPGGILILLVVLVV